MTAMALHAATAASRANRRYNRFLLLVAGLGGLLYGVDVGIVGGALPYLEATSRLTPGQLSAIVAAVLLGSVISTLFAGIIADWLGRKPLMVASGLSFLISIPVIALSHGFEPLFLGRLLQGVSGGFIGIVVPLYLAECLSAGTRGKGTGLFQLMLTLGILAAALVGIYYSYRVQAIAAAPDANALFAFKDHAWRRIFWVSMPPGLLFVLGSLFVSESPRWLFRRGKKDQAYAILLRSRSTQQAKLELCEMDETATKPPAGKATKNSLFRRKFVLPFLLACVVLACNTATGVNSVIGYCTGTLLQSGLGDLAAHWGYVLLTFVNFAFTVAGMELVDRKGRRFLLILGTSGIVVSLASVGLLFLKTEKQSVDAAVEMQSRVSASQELTVQFDAQEATRLLAARSYAGNAIPPDRRIDPAPPPSPSSTPTETSPAPPASSAPTIPPPRPSASTAPPVSLPTPSSRSSRTPSPTSPPPAPRHSSSGKRSSGESPRPATAGWSRSASTPSWPSTPSAPVSASGSPFRNSCQPASGRTA